MSNQPLPGYVNQPLDDSRYIIIGLCGHWWQIDPQPVDKLIGADLPDCPRCGRPAGAVLMWVELYPDMGRGPKLLPLAVLR